MSQQARIQAVLDNVVRPGRNVEWPKNSKGDNLYISEIYGSNVFTLKKLQNSIPKPVYARFVQQIKVNQVDLGTSTFGSSYC